MQDRRVANVVKSIECVHLLAHENANATCNLFILNHANYGHTGCRKLDGYLLLRNVYMISAELREYERVLKHPKTLA